MQIVIGDLITFDSSAWLKLIEKKHYAGSPGSPAEGKENSLKGNKIGNKIQDGQADGNSN